MRPPRARRGFTLIELLTVIAIIAILMGLLLPVLNSAKNAAKKAEAKSDIANIVTAVRAYYTDYGQYPTQGAAATPGSGASTSLTFGDSAGSQAQLTNDNLFNVLRASQDMINNTVELSENPRETVYIEVPTVKDPSAPKEGIIPSGAASGKQDEYVDPWGQQYNVRVDSGYTGSVNVNPPYQNTPSTSNSYVNTGVVAWSYGPNGHVDNNVQASNFDDILSWQ